MTLLRYKTQYLQNTKKTLFFFCNTQNYLPIFYIKKDNNNICRYIAKLYIQLIHIYKPDIAIIIVAIFSCYLVHTFIYCKQQLHLILYEFQNKTTHFLTNTFTIFCYLYGYMFPYIPIYIYINVPTCILLVHYIYVCI